MCQRFVLFSLATQVAQQEYVGADSRGIVQEPGESDLSVRALLVDAVLFVTRSIHGTGSAMKIRAPDYVRTPC